MQVKVFLEQSIFLCDTALVYGFATSAEWINADLVRMVIQNKTEFGVLPLEASP